MTGRAVFFVAMAAVGAIIFLVLDQGLSGASATNPIYVILFFSVCLGLIVLMLSGRSGAADVVNWIAGAAPLVLGILYLAGDWYWRHRPENAGNRAIADNILCAARAAGMSDRDWPMVRTGIGSIAMHGEFNGAEQREIEERLRIRVLPGCRFERF